MRERQQEQEQQGISTCSVEDLTEDTIALATGSSEGSAERNSDAWVLQTFAAVEKRVQNEGLWTGVTLFDSHVGQIGL